MNKKNILIAILFIYSVSISIYVSLEKGIIFKKQAIAWGGLYDNRSEEQKIGIKVFKNSKPEYHILTEKEAIVAICMLYFKNEDREACKTRIGYYEF